MGPRSFNRGNYLQFTQHQLRTILLQWGRGLSTAEIATRSRVAAEGRSCFNGAAVFQPRKWRLWELGARTFLTLQWGRGLSTAEIGNRGVARSGRRSCFNGAAVFQPRKCIPRHPLCRRFRALQWGRGLSTAEMSNGREHRDGGIQRFNGAAVFQPRKSPHPSLPSPSGPGFNGAAVFQPRKSRRTRPPGPAGCGFNGAAVFQPRKWSFHPKRCGSKSTLQWGRGLSTAEIRPLCRADEPRNVASMGPRSFNRGNRTLDM